MMSRFIEQDSSVNNLGALNVEEFNPAHNKQIIYAHNATICKNQFKREIYKNLCFFYSILKQASLNPLKKIDIKSKEFNQLKAVKV